MFRSVVIVATLLLAFAGALSMAGLQPTALAADVGEGVGESVGVIQPDRHRVDDTPLREDLGGRLSYIEAQPDQGRIVLFLRTTDGLDGVVLVGPAKRTLSEQFVSVGQRRVVFNVPVETGTYEVVTVRLDDESAGTLGAEASELNSQPATFNLSAATTSQPHKPAVTAGHAV